VEIILFQQCNRYSCVGTTEVIKYIVKKFLLRDLTFPRRWR